MEQDNTNLSNTNTFSNWLLDQEVTEITKLKDEKNDILNNLGNEIFIKAQTINSENSKTENEIRSEVDLQNLPLYLPKELTEKRVSATLNHTHNTQRWIGYITEIYEKKFKAKLEDLTKPGTFEYGTFDIKEAFDEKEMIKIGAIFYFSVGYNVIKGTHIKQQFLRFQRLTEWSERDYEEAISRADRIVANLTWE